ncbi:MAG: hypothetical protein ACJ71R_13245 [Nitrososphaeraceae archaeon]
MNKEQIVTKLILMGLFGGIVGGWGYYKRTRLSCSSSKTPLVIYHYSRIHWIYMRRHNGIFRKVKEKAMMTENCADIFKVFRDYKLSSASNSLSVSKRNNQ